MKTFSTHIIFPGKILKVICCNICLKTSQHRYAVIFLVFQFQNATINTIALTSSLHETWPNKTCFSTYDISQMNRRMQSTRFTRHMITLLTHCSRACFPTLYTIITRPACFCHDIIIFCCVLFAPSLSRTHTHFRAPEKTTFNSKLYHCNL